MKTSKRKRALKFRLKLKKITLKDTGCEDTADSLSPEPYLEKPFVPLGKFNQSKMYQILPNLFMSGFSSAKSLKAIKENQISHIINLTSQHCENPHQEIIEYSNFRLSDNSSFNLLGQLSNITQEIHNKIQIGKKVLVHCKMGVSRAPSIVIAYLILKRGMTYNSGFDYVLGINPKIAPNLGYLMQLQNLETKENIFN